MPLVILEAFRWYHYFIFENKYTVILVATAWKTACVLIELRYGGHFTVSQLWQN